MQYIFVCDSLFFFGTFGEEKTIKNRERKNYLEKKVLLGAG